jgi:hypothetical protein
MRSSQKIWHASKGWTGVVDGSVGADAQWVLVFGAREALAQPEAFAELRAWHPRALIVGCSTSGEIAGDHVHDNTLVATSVRFDRTTLRFAVARVLGTEDSHGAGMALASELNRPGLAHIMVLSDGLNVNGSALARGLREHLPASVAVTGGLAGDADRFEKTLVYLGADALENRIVAIGFYGDRLHVGYGSLGGWDSFGPWRLITRSKGNVLYELDGRSALDLYKEYLGEHAAGLPASGLLFPLALQNGHSAGGLVRTVLGVDEREKSMAFAGDMPEGCDVRLMKTNFNRLVDGAEGAARGGLETLGGFAPELAVLISCVGRKLVLKQRVEEEVEAVRRVLGPQTILTGFYSYGEISPAGTITQCELHNQTMTITTFAEA